MNEEKKGQVNIDAEGENGLSQDKIEDLFKSLDEAYVASLLEQAGLSEDDLAEAEQLPEDSEPDTAASDAEASVSDGSGPEIEGAAEEPEAEADAVEAPKPDDAVATEDADAVAGLAAEAVGGNLEPEHIGHLLRVLGDDMIKDMLQDAGLSDDGSEPDDSPDAKDTDTPDVGAAKASPVRRKLVRRKGSRTRRFLLLAIFAGIVLLVIAVNQISMNVTLNSDDPIQYSEMTDDISALEGSLKVNDVSVAVPTDGSEEYSISYVWAEDDDKYPSVPQAITAVYKGNEGENLYTITLYRSETIPKKSMPKGKKVSNWFDSWEVVTEGDVLQKPLKSGSLNGFYIYPQMNEDGTGTTSDYNDYSYYFAVKERGGISIYVVEGVCLDPESTPAFTKIMDGCIQSITIKGTDKDKTKETEESETQQA